MGIDADVAYIRGKLESELPAIHARLGAHGVKLDRIDERTQELALAHEEHKAKLARLGVEPPEDLKESFGATRAFIRLLPDIWHILLAVFIAVGSGLAALASAAYHFGLGRR